MRNLQVAFAWAVSIEPEEGTQLLLRLGLLDPALDYALESGAFAQAFQLCQGPAAQHKMPECHLKYAMHLEDEGKPKRGGGGKQRYGGWQGKVQEHVPGDGGGVGEGGFEAGSGISPQCGNGSSSSAASAKNICLLCRLAAYVEIARDANYRACRRLSHCMCSFFCEFYDAITPNTLATTTALVIAIQPSYLCKEILHIRLLYVSHFYHPTWLQLPSPPLTPTSPSPLPRLACQHLNPALVHMHAWSQV